MLLQPEMGNDGLLVSLSVSLACPDVLIIPPHPQPACVVEGFFLPFFFLFHIKEFGSYQILAVIERNHCCRATNTDVAVLLNSISWFSNADRL